MATPQIQGGRLPMKKRLILCFIIVILLPCLAMGEEPPIGKIKTGKGDVGVIRSGAEIAIHIGDPLYQKDIIRTGDDSSVGIIFEDNTILSLGPKSEIVIDEYVFAPEKDMMSMLIHMVKGTACYMSGIIGRQSPESVKFQTPDATIGIRGTQFLVMVKGG
jgi:hypothetical protein